MDDKILACVDPRGNTDAVIDWAAWAAVRTGAPLEFLHVLERHPEHAATKDFSGAIGLGSQEALLRQLSEEDAARSVQQREDGRRLLAHARERAAAAGAARLDARLRHGDFVATTVELQGGVGLFVLGEHHHASLPARLRGEHHLEQVVRGVRAPVLVATTDAFLAPERIVLAFDGSPMARKALAALGQQPLLAGLPVRLAWVGDDTPAARQQLRQAQAALEAEGRSVDSELIEGEPEQVLPQHLKARPPALLVMGAYGHSRLWQWLRGSTTTSLLRLSDVPVLILR